MFECLFKGMNSIKKFWGALPSKLGYCFILSLVTLISYMPFRVLYFLSDILFFPFYYVVRYRRRIVRKNLTESFPSKSRQDIKEIEKQFYHFFLDMTFESCKLISISPEEMKRRVKFVHIEMVNELLAQGKSIATFIGHYGNWEWVPSISLWLYKDAVPSHIYHKLRNKQMDKLMKRIRGRWGSVGVDMHEVVRYMAHATTDNKPYIIGFIADQSPRKRESKYFIPFLNHNVPVLTGTEKVTKHYGYEAVFLSMRRVKRGYYECELTTLHDDPRSLPNFQLTDLYFRHLEQEIMAHPEYYLWTHRRFKYARIPLT